MAKKTRINGWSELYPADSFDPEKTLLPKATREVLIAENFQEVDNFHLKFHKCARFIIEQSGKQPKPGAPPEEPKRKFSFLKTKAGKPDSSSQEDEPEGIFRLRVNFGDVNCAAIHERQNRAVKNLGLEVETLQKLTLGWRLSLGLGNESVYETSLTLHHTYGIPYLPGSSLKGVTRSWVIEKVFGKNEAQALQHKAFCKLFGCPADGEFGEERKGAVVFFDAFPDHIKPEHVVPDVVNPHFGKYHNQPKNPLPPGDWQQPVPVFFLTVKGATFSVRIGIEPKENEEKMSLGKFSGKPLEVAKAWLEAALKEHGIGAKTAVGYGRLSNSNP